VFGIEVALLPAAELGTGLVREIEMAIVNRKGKDRNFTGDLQGRLK
jgi:hypothetical protein